MFTDKLSQRVLSIAFAFLMIAGGVSLFNFSIQDLTANESNMLSPLATDEYIILGNEDGKALKELISKKLSEGWRCQGGVSVVFNPHDDNKKYFQAMVK